MPESTESEPTVFVVDDDAALCESLQWLLEAAGLRVQTFLSAEAFLAAGCASQPGCLVLDVRMPGMSGLDLHTKLIAENCPLPVIFMTGHGDVPTAIRAVRAGACEFLQKPVDDQVLVSAIRAALERDRRSRQRQSARREVLDGLRRLTPREREVLRHVLKGDASKQIAAVLEIAEKTVEAHRKHIMDKLGVRNVADLVRVVMLAHEAPGNPR